MNKKLTIKSIWFFSITLFALFLNGCSINDSNSPSGTEELTDEELEVAGQIIAESLSDQKDGIFASLNDAFTLPSSSDFDDNSTSKGKFSSAVLNSATAKNESSEENYSYSYDPDTGTHLVIFSRTVNEDDFSKESSAELEYIYYDSNGEFIYSPRVDNEQIETIEYNGVRNGSIISPQKTSSYERHDELLIDGLSSGSDFITIDGLHEGSGQFKVTRGNGDEIERNYTLTAEFLNVRINTQLFSASGSLQNGVEGALTYEMMISKNINGDESMKTVNGTIEFNGDGTALLRFQNILENFKVKLNEGNLLEDDEFEGFIRTVDTENERFTLYNEESYLFGTDTEIDPDGDLTSLDEVESVLGTVVRVKADGTFVDNTDGAHIIQTVKFEYEDEDLEFEGTVEEADAESNTIVLSDETVLNIDEDTVFDSDGDLSTLEEVIWALENDFKVKAEGDLTFDGAGSLTVAEVKFEYNEDDFEFDDEVISVNTEDNSFALEDEETYRVDENTIFDEDSDAASLEEAAAALSGGNEVEAEGEYVPQPDGSRLVTLVKFETEDTDDDDSDDDNEDREETDFSGVVETADAAAKTFTLRNGFIIHVTEETEFDDNIQSLGNLVGALQRGDRVIAEGEYYTDDDERKIAAEVEFDVNRNGDDDEDDNDDPEMFEFEENVVNADAAAKTFELENGLLLHVTNNTEFDGDINSLGNLVGAIQRGDKVEAEGEYFTDENGNNIVTKVEFDAERRDDDDEDDNGDDDENEDDNEDDEDNDDDEDRQEFDFEGRVASANVSDNSFSLNNGLTLFVNSDTEFDNDEIESIEELADALNNGDEVEAEGEYYTDEESRNIVIEVEFEAERNDDDDDDDDETEEKGFGGRINSVDLADNSFELMNGRTYVLDNNTTIENNSDLFSLQEVADDISAGFVVTTNGKYSSENDGTRLVLNVKFNSNRNDDDDDEDEENDEDREESDFEGSVASANVSDNSFSLNNGLTLFVNSDTEFDDDDIESIEELADALNDGDEVEAEGEYYTDNEARNIVIEVEFEAERSDDDDDEEDNEDREEFDFEGSVASANVSDNSFSLNNGLTLFVNSDTEFDDDDIESIEELADALNDGDEVEAEGEYYTDDEGLNVAIEVEFDVEENDDDEDDDDDDENGDDNNDDEDDEDEDDDD